MQKLSTGKPSIANLMQQEFSFLNKTACVDSPLKLTESFEMHILIRETFGRMKDNPHKASSSRIKIIGLSEIGQYRKYKITSMNLLLGKQATKFRAEVFDILQVATRRSGRNL